MDPVTEGNLEVDIMIEYPPKNLFGTLPQMVCVFGNHTSLTSVEFQDWLLNLSPFWRYLRTPIEGASSYTLIETSLEAKEYLCKLKKHTLTDGGLVELREVRNPLMTASEIKDYFNRPDPNLKIFLKDVSKKFKRKELVAYFSQFGEIKSFKVVVRPGKAANIGYLEFWDVRSSRLVLALRHNVFVARKEVILPLIMTNDEFGARFEEGMKRVRRVKGWDALQFDLDQRRTTGPCFKLLKRNNGSFVVSPSGHRPLEAWDHPSNLKFNFGSGYKSNRIRPQGPQVHQRLELHQQKTSNTAFTMNDLIWNQEPSGESAGWGVQGVSWGKCTERTLVHPATGTPWRATGCFSTCLCSPNIASGSRINDRRGQFPSHPMFPWM